MRTEGYTIQDSYRGRAKLQATRYGTASMNPQQHILIVDDDPDLRNLLTRYLKEQGIQATAVEDGEAMDRFLKSSPAVDLVILDLMLPGEDGLSIARRLKGSSNIPIIILSAKGDDIDRIIGLEMGADDYLPKPFNPRELLARMRAVLRRPSSTTQNEPEVRSFGIFQLDTAGHRLLCNGNLIPLTSGEFELLKVFTEHPRRVLSRDWLLEHLKGYERGPFDRSVDVRVTRLRKKIEMNPAEPLYIRTIWGEGYIFDPDGG